MTRWPSRLVARNLGFRRIVPLTAEMAVIVSPSGFKLETHGVREREVQGSLRSTSGSTDMKKVGFRAMKGRQVD